MADPLVVTGVCAGAIGIAQPWIIALWKRFFRRGIIDTYVTGNIEVGFGPLGPSIALGGTLRAVNRDLYVSGIDLQVTRVKDSSMHTFPWAAFRPYRLPVAPIGQQPSIEIASGFMISRQSPHRFLVLFVDTETAKEMYPLVNQLFQGLQDVKDLQGLDRLSQPVQFAPGMSAEKLEALLQAYRQHSNYGDAYTKLTKICYWEAGTYKLLMSVRTARPERTFPAVWTFQLTEADAKHVALNVFSVLEGPIRMEMGQPAAMPYLAFPEYKEARP